MTKEEVLQLEKELSFQEFNNHDAYQLGQIIVDHIEKNHLKNVRIRIVLDKDIIFQYLMDGKKGVIWLDRKQKTVEKYGHSSYYIYLENEENKTYQEDEKDESLVICGGGFPLIIHDELRGSILVSGLVHDEDHQVIVDCLRKLKDASDIDGTLVFNQQIKKQDKEAIEKYQKEHLFGVCSGRPRCALFDLEKLKLDFYILSSGAMILDKGLNIIQDFSMKKEIVQQIFNEYKKKAHIILQTGNADVFYATLKEDYNPKLKVISSFKEVEHEIIYGISLVFKDDKITKKACLEINQKYQEVEGFQNRNSIDIVRKGCSKGTGIKIIKDYYHLEKVAGIGDSYNDLPMLKVVDTAFTFKTSPQEIQKQVHYCVNDIAEAIALLEVEK